MTKINNIHKIILYKFFSSLDFVLPVQALFLLLKGFSFGGIMFLSSVTLIASIISEIPTGYIGDKVGRKNTLICGCLIGILTWALWYFASIQELFFVCAVLFGIARSFISGADQAFIYDDLHGKEMTKWFGIYSSASVFGSAFAAIVTGIINIDNTENTFYVLYRLVIVSQVISLFFLLLLQEKKREEVLQNTPFLETVKEGFQLIFKSQKIMSLLLLFIFTSPLSIFLMNVFQLYFVEADVHPSMFGYSVLLSSLFAGGLKIFAHKLVSMVGIKWALFLSNILPALIWSAMAFVIHPVLSIFIFILADGFGNLKDPIYADLFNKDIPTKIRATTLSSLALLASLYLAVMNPLLGIIADYNLFLSFLLCSLIIGLSSIVFQLRFNKYHN